jgi:hypothetical protein
MTTSQKTKDPKKTAKKPSKNSCKKPAKTLKNPLEAIWLNTT